MSAVFVNFDNLTLADFISNFLRLFPEWHVARSIIKIELVSDHVSFAETLRFLSKYPPVRVGEDLPASSPKGKCCAISIDLRRIMSLLQKNSFIEDPRRIFYKILHKIRKSWEKEGVYWKR